MSRTCVDCDAKLVNPKAMRCPSCASSKKMADLYGFRPLTTTQARRVIEHVSRKSGVPYDSIIGVRRSTAHSQPRRRAMRILHRLGHSYVDIGFAFGRHPATIAVAVKARA